ncbi:hypothetical protein H1R20_g4051, partial [Candolleomyces eurysporus]
MLDLRSVNSVILGFNDAAVPDATASPEARAAAIEELKYFVDEKPFQSPRTMVEAFTSLSRDLEEFIARTASGDLKEQLRVLAQKAYELANIWSATVMETIVFRETIATAVETLTIFGLKKRLQVARGMTDRIGVSLERYIAGI